MASTASNDGMVIGGIRVSFPVKPYPSQVAMTAQIIKGLNKGEHCLLESPTGTGKSLSLLCSTLAWQAAEEDRANRYNDLLEQGITDLDILGQIYNSRPWSDVPQRSDSLATRTPGSLGPQNDTLEDLRVRPLTHQQPSNSADATLDSASKGDLGKNSISQAGGFLKDTTFHNDDVDFVETTVPFSDSNETYGGNVTMNNGGRPNRLDDSRLETAQTNQENTSRLRKKKAPKIFFGTRTHKQIFQIIREFRKTKYSNIRSVVLGSREHYCIHPVVSKSNNKNEGCKALLDNQDGDYCSYRSAAQRILSQDQLAAHGLPVAWDVEDLVRAGKRARACPYFVSKQLLETAQIIFCPYNYLIDPLIRQSMNVNIQGHIVVLDEAHNIEDSSRDAASVSQTQDQLLMAKSDLEKLVYNEIKPNACQPLIQLLSNLSLWMESNKDKLTDYSEFSREGKIFSGPEMIKHLINIDVDSEEAVSNLEKCLGELTEDPEDKNERTDEMKPTAATLQLLSGLFLIFKYLFKGNMKHVEDYKVALVKSQAFSTSRVHKNASGWFGRKNTSLSNDFTYTLHFWCLNPGVVFSEIGVMAKAIILTSGTLSPMNSFESELQVKFGVKFEGSHVIKSDQAWVGTISSGPTNQPLNATYKHSEGLAFQDELGRVVLETCQVIPRGVLCFLPSYAMLDKLVQRWQNSLVWDKITETKLPILEPRGNAGDFENAIKLFYKTIEETRDNNENTGLNGALFIAVCRGKVSEGLDFTDDNARAVIAVGIPFPNFKDIQVNLKKEYNDLNVKAKGLLSGRDWYEIQAYRALNQALGRCIRHSLDWGAIILVDERFRKNPRYTGGLSKWVRNSLRNSLRHQEVPFNEVLSQLSDFAQKMKERDESRSCISNDASCLEPPSTDNGKPKFASPPSLPSLFPFSKNSKSDSGKKNTSSPLRDSQGIPLTPISHRSPGRVIASQGYLVFRLASTQKDADDKDKVVADATGNTVSKDEVGFSNSKSTDSPKVSTLSSTSTPKSTGSNCRESSSGYKFYSIFNSDSKTKSRKRKSSDSESEYRLDSNTTENKLDTSTTENKLDTSTTENKLDTSTTENKLDNHSSTKRDNTNLNFDDIIYGEMSLENPKHKDEKNSMMESPKDDDSFKLFLSDDLFSDEDDLEPRNSSVKENNHNKMNGVHRLKSEKKTTPLIVEKTTLSETSDHGVSKSGRRNSLPRPPKEIDSDLDDFNLDSSILRRVKKSSASKTKSVRRPKRKGVVFTDFD